MTINRVGRKLGCLALVIGLGAAAFLVFSRMQQTTLGGLAPPFKSKMRMDNPKVGDLVVLDVDIYPNDARFSDDDLPDTTRDVDFERDPVEFGMGSYDIGDIEIILPDRLRVVDAHPSGWKVDDEERSGRQKLIWQLNRRIEPNETIRRQATLFVEQHDDGVDGIRIIVRPPRANDRIVSLVDELLYRVGDGRDPGNVWYEVADIPPSVLERDPYIGIEPFGFTKDGEFRVPSSNLPYPDKSDIIHYAEKLAVDYEFEEAPEAGVPVTVWWGSWDASGNGSTYEGKVRFPPGWTITSVTAADGFDAGTVLQPPHDNMVVFYDTLSSGQAVTRTMQVLPPSTAEGPWMAESYTNLAPISDMWESQDFLVEYSGLILADESFLGDTVKEPASKWVDTRNKTNFTGQRF